MYEFKFQSIMWFTDSNVRATKAIKTKAPKLSKIKSYPNQTLPTKKGSRKTNLYTQTRSKEKRKGTTRWLEKCCKISEMC